MRGWVVGAMLALAACAPYQPEVVEPSPEPVPMRTPPPGAPPGQGVEVEDLTNSARKKAQAGDCAASRQLADRVRELDPDYYRAFVVPDPVITRCWQGAPGTAGP